MPHIVRRIRGCLLASRNKLPVHQTRLGRQTPSPSCSSVSFSNHGTSYSTSSTKLVSVQLRIHNEALEAVAEQKSASISFRLCQQRQENVSQFRHDLFHPEDLQRLRQVQHFGDRGRFFHVPSAQRVCQTGHLTE